MAADNNTVNIRLESKWSEWRRRAAVREKQHIQPAHNRKLNGSKSKHHIARAQSEKTDGKHHHHYHHHTYTYYTYSTQQHAYNGNAKKGRKSRACAYAQSFGIFIAMRSCTAVRNIFTNAMLPHTYGIVDMDTDTNKNSTEKSGKCISCIRRVHVCLCLCVGRLKVDAACTKCSRLWISHCIAITCILPMCLCIMLPCSCRGDFSKNKKKKERADLWWGKNS